MTTTPARQTVLLAEDHADTRMFYAELFRASSFDVMLPVSWQVVLLPTPVTEVVPVGQVPVWLPVP